MPGCEQSWKVTLGCGTDPLGCGTDQRHWGVEQIHLEAAVPAELRADENLNPWFSSESCFASYGTFDNVQKHFRLSQRGERCSWPGMLLNIPQRTVQPSKRRIIWSRTSVAPRWRNPGLSEGSNTVHWKERGRHRWSRENWVVHEIQGHVGEQGWSSLGCEEEQSRSEKTVNST